MQDVVLLRVVHVIKGLHGAADLLAGHLLEEGEGKAVSPRAILSSDDEGVELRLPGVHLRPESQTLWHTELGGKPETLMSGSLKQMLTISPASQQWKCDARLATIPCRRHPGQMDSIQHCQENVLELWT